MEMKTVGPLTACSTSTRKRKANAEDSAPKTKSSLVVWTNREKGINAEDPNKPVLVACISKAKREVEEEPLPLPPSDDTIDEDWEHTILSQSSDSDSDNERTYSDLQQTLEDFCRGEGKDISDDDEFERQFSRVVLRRAFSIPVEKRAKFLRQKEKIMRLSVLLNRRLDITRDSSDEDVFQKLDKEGLINMPKRTAMAYINGAISRKECFYQHDLRYEIVKKLVTVVPCITVETSYCSSRVANFVRKMGLTNISSDMLVSPLFYMESTLSRIMEDEIHPVIHKERIKEILSVVETDAKRNCREWIQRWKDCPDPCFVHQIKQVEAEIKSSKVYQEALKVVQLHQEFRKHLASCLFIKHDMKVKELIKDMRVVESRFEGLDKSLIKASLKERIKLLKKIHDLDVYYAWLIELVDCKIKEGRSRMDEILHVIRAEHPDFPKLPDKWVFRKVRNIPHGWTDKEKQEELNSFYELLDKVKEHTRCPLSYAFVIEGILDYMQACEDMIEDVSYLDDSEDPSSYINSNVRSRWLRNKAWDETFYEHPAYTIVYEDVSSLM